MARLAQRLLLTGAAGNIGRDLRTRLAAHCQALRVSDAADVGPARPGEECVAARLEDAQAMDQLLAGVDAVVHMGGVPEERSFESILAANIVGLRNLYEAARAAMACAVWSWPARCTSRAFTAKTR